MSAPYDYTQQYHPHQQGPPSDPYGPPPPYNAQPPPGAFPPPYAAPYAAPYGGPPPGAGYGSYPPPSGGHDEVRTIFITGFPADVKERELNNLLRFMPGYEAGQMNWKNGQAQGFALFASGAYARSACDMITQLCFDDVSVLRCEMARKNMYIKEDSAMKRPRLSGPPSSGSAPYPTHSSRPAPSSYSSGPSAGGAGHGGGGGGGGGSALDIDNPPCNTLFIGNLGDSVSEGELKALFGASPGFKLLKVVRGQRNTTCFVDYEDIASATVMHAANQGAVIQSSDRGALRVQFAKNPYGKKRDVTGILIDTLPRDHPGAAPGTI